MAKKTDKRMLKMMQEAMRAVAQREASERWIWTKMQTRPLVLELALMGYDADPRD